MNTAVDLPSSLEDLISDLEAANREHRLGPATPEAAALLGAARSCDVCGRTIVDVSVLTEALLARYDSRDEVARRRLVDLLRRSPLETGDNLSPNYCSYHAQITSE